MESLETFRILTDTWYQQLEISGLIVKYYVIIHSKSGKILILRKYFAFIQSDVY